MNTIKLEIRASEGGMDAKLLVKDLTDIYSRFCRNNDVGYSVEEKDGFNIL